MKKLRITIEKLAAATHSEIKNSPNLSFKKHPLNAIHVKFFKNSNNEGEKEEL